MLFPVRKLANTRQRGSAQRNGRPLLSYRRRTFAARCMGKFGYHGNMGRLRSSLNDTVILLDQNPHFGTRIWHLLLHKPSYSQFCVHIASFSLSWQQVSVRGQLFERNHETGRPRKLPLWYKNPLYRPSYRQFCVQTSKLVLWSHFADSRTPLL